MPEIPSKLIKSLQDVTGFNEQSFIGVHEVPAQVTSIRLNPAKPVTFHNDTERSSAPLESTDVVPWCPEGRYLSQRPSFTLDPAFHAGAYYVQEASSMFLSHIIQHIYNGGNKAQTVLDLCAAPGGKSTLLASFFAESLMVSNEVIRQRVTILAENMSKWGSSNVLVTHNDPKDFKKLGGFFELIVVDAPCSGSGLFRKDEDAIEEWSESNVQMCSMRQQRILADVLPALKQDGYLIYSTCSYSKEEDEDICDWIVDNKGLTPVRIPFEKSWGIVETHSDKHKVPAYRFYPDKIKGEGFFIACFKQPEEADHYGDFAPELTGVGKAEKAILKEWILQPDFFTFFRQNETIIAFRKKFEDELQLLLHALNVRKSGVAIGSLKGKDFIPHHELALSQLLLPSITSVEMDKENALRYLKRKDMQIALPEKGWMIARYNGLNLGWIKVLSNRINNYYPVDWRILKD